jgi:hypothetical protein
MESSKLSPGAGLAQKKAARQLTGRKLSVQEAGHVTPCPDMSEVKPQGQHDVARSVRDSVNQSETAGVTDIG